jgi:hypothetical protein
MRTHCLLSLFETYHSVPQEILGIYQIKLLDLSFKFQDKINFLSKLKMSLFLGKISPVYGFGQKTQSYLSKPGVFNQHLRRVSLVPPLNHNLAHNTHVRAKNLVRYSMSASVLKSSFKMSL